VIPCVYSITYLGKHKLIKSDKGITEIEKGKKKMGGSDSYSDKLNNFFTVALISYRSIMLNVHSIRLMVKTQKYPY
jgi:hypothetical protein